MRVALALGLALLAAFSASALAAPPPTSLTITHWGEGEQGAKQTWTLRCSPTGGTHFSRAAACRRLAQLSAPFKPVPKDAVCTAVFGGPSVAFVRGTFEGRRVWTWFRLRDGCQISRWKRVVPLLPSPGVT